ncbi:hypothetical protein BH20ACI4_BH20ACI4_03200 [soil metagenome]
MLDIIGFVFVIVLTIFAYKTAKDYERNAIGWALITFAVVIGIQIILPVSIILIIIIIATIATAGGSSPHQIQDAIPIATISIIFKILSIVAGFLILRHLAKIPEEKSFDIPPEPPSDFNQTS